METFFDKYVMPFLYLLEEMAPFLLLGFFIAGLLHAFVPRNFYRRYLGKDNLGSVLMAILVGIPLPLCSCGVIPTALSMRKDGASRSATTSFLIATPQTGVDSIAASWSVLGLPFAIIRPIAALITALGGGVASLLAFRHTSDPVRESAPEKSSSDHEKKGFWARIREALSYAFDDMLSDIGGRLVVGLLIAGLITVLVPDNFFASYASNGFVNMLIMLVIAVPMYVCATGSIPIAVALILKGVNPGAALVFLMAGPAVNVATIMVLGKELGRKTMNIYILSVIIGSITMGLIIDNLLPLHWFTDKVNASYTASCHEDGAGNWIQIVSTVALVALLIRIFIKSRRHGGHHCACCNEDAHASCCHHHEEEHSCCHHEEKRPCCCQHDE